MDVGAFVQENRRWLIGCAVGGLVWLIASSVIESMYKPALLSALRLGAPDKVFDRDALAAAKAEGEQLDAERARLQEALVFAPSEKYQLAGKGSAGDYLFQVSRDLKQVVERAANPRDVQVASSNLVWEMPLGIDDIRSTLFALELVDEVQQRLFAAHDATRAVDDDAPGLRAITSLKVDARRNQKSVYRTPKAGEPDVRDFLVQEQISVQFQADEPTALAFFESCRKPNRTLVVDSWQLVRPAKVGEVCSVKATLLGIAFKGGS